MKTINRSEHVSRHSSGLKLDTPLLVVLLHPSATAHTHTRTILRLALNTVWWVAPFLRSYPTKITVRGSLILWLLFLLAHQHFRIIVLLCNCKLALHQVHDASGMNLFYLAPSLSPLPLSLSLSLSPSLPLSLSPSLPLSLSPSLPLSLSPSLPPPTLIPSLPLLHFSPDRLSWEDGGRGDTPPWFPGSSVPHLQGRLLWTSLIPPHPLPLLLSRLQGTDNTAWQEIVSRFIAFMSS